METSAEQRACIDIDGPKIEDLSSEDATETLYDDRIAREEGKKKKWRMREERGLLDLVRKSRSSPRPSSECCIFRVPQKLQQSSKEAYTPRVIAIGPYYDRHSESLRPMESHKRLYLGSFLRQSKKPYHDYVKTIASWMNSIMNCYEDKASFHTDPAEMMLLDGSFIIQLFLINNLRKCGPHGDDDLIFDKPWMLNNIRRDMMLLENQIPFFVVQGLFEMAYESQAEPMPGLLELAYDFFRPVMMTEVQWTVKESEVKHFLDAIRSSYLSSMESRETQEEIKFIPNATDLVGAGVKLRKSEN
ncbi:uncharacterized protein J3R85_019515 [Psidium guajava]|nr:uncharacterized protein J3R85_019515 [Psidium guajava]